MSQVNPRLPFSVTLHLTEACNLRCKMCYYWGETGCFTKDDSKKKPTVLEYDVLEPVIKYLAKAKPMYSLFGGEPLMYPDLEKLIIAIKGNGSSIDTPTNGTLLEKNAEMLVRTGFDSIRVSIDGPREISDAQRGKGSFDKAFAGIEALYDAREKAGAKQPAISIIYTVTQENHQSIEQFFLKDLNLQAISMVTIQMQNFITQPMGEAYGKMLKNELGLTSDTYWRGALRSPDDFSDMDTVELCRQVDAVRKRFSELGKNVLLLPRKVTPENLDAYIGARWSDMSEKYRKCPVPWTALDITADGYLAPCHVYYDLVAGNIKDESFENIWNGEIYSKFRSYMEKHGLMSICHGCCSLYLAGY